MRYLLDSNAVIAIFKQHHGFIDRLKQFSTLDFYVPSIVLHDLCYGAYKSQRKQENLRRIESLRFGILDFDREDARHAGEVRAALVAAGTIIGPYDVLIAGQAISRQLTLVTRNLREFQRIPNLCVEDWEV